MMLKALATLPLLLYGVQESRVLTENSELEADGLAYVINDDLGNSYQKILP